MKVKVYSYAKKKKKIKKTPVTEKIYFDAQKNPLQPPPKTHEVDRSSIYIKCHCEYIKGLHEEAVFSFTIPMMWRKTNKVW